MSERNGSQPHHYPIAIVGMASIFPQAATLREYWDNILNKIDSIMDVPPSHWAIDSYYDADPLVPDKVYSKRGGFIPEIDFDPLEYGLPPNILEVTDTSQLLSLVVAKDALIDAGYLDAPEPVRERTGIILGVGGGQKLITPLIARLQYPVWAKVLKSVGIADEDIDKIIEKMKLAYVKWEENSFPGLLGNVVSGRVANRFDLGGINTVVDAACASSLSALNAAMNELHLGHSDMMLAGGVDTDNSVFMYMCFSKTPAFSRGDRPRPFDASSDGMMVGEGLGMVVLKRLEDAERDGDRIYAVIKGVGSSSDGRYKSIYAPRSEGQERALRRAYDRAGIAPATVDLIEAHGTGTVTGDIIESQTLVRYFSQETSEKHAVALGSVKSQIGHTKAAAGVAGLIKVALSLYHQVLPPTINIDQPNPKLNLEDSALYLNTEARPWLRPADGSPRRAGVSAFGFGGTNFHAVLEEYTGPHKTSYRLNNAGRIILLGADSPAALQILCETHLSRLSSDQPQEANQYFNELARTIPTLAIQMARLGFVARSAVEARDLLRAALDMMVKQPQADEWQLPKGGYYRKTGMDLTGKVVALFSGQGSQYVNMGRELALNFPPLRESYQAIDALFARDQADALLSTVVFPPPPATDAQTSALQSTEYAQPAIGAFSSGLYKLLRDAGFKANFVAGHSFGELTALWAAGTLSDEDYYALVRARGRAMAPQNTPGFDAGTMLAVTGDVAGLSQEIAAFPGVVIANLNSPKQVVLAGPRQAIESAQQALKTKGYNVVPLPVSAAFHTPLVDHAQKPFAEAIQRTTFSAPNIPVYSNVTGDQYPTDPAAMQQQLSGHLLRSVQFHREIENIHAAGGYLFVEFGPRNILTNLVKEILNGKPHLAIALNANRQKDSDLQFRDVVTQLCVLGLPVGDIDPYLDLPAAPAVTKRKGMTIRLCGANYVSEKTRSAFDEALKDGFKVTLPAAAPSAVGATPVVPAVSVAAPVVAPQTIPAHAEPSGLEVLQRSLAHFEAQQREMLGVHEQYLNNQTEYFHLFYQLTQQQQAVIASQTLTPGTVENLTRSLSMLHDHQAETLRVHEHYLHQQSEGLQSFLQLIREQYLNLSHQPVTAAVPVFMPVAVPVIAPVPKPAPVAAAAPVVAALPKAPAAPVAAVPVPSSPVPVAPVVPPAPVAPAVTVPAASSPQAALLAEGMLAVVSEKTGYPAEMLELSMDMEADLGIDSIKRVEILGAMRERFTELPPFKAEELAELRTLQQIVDYMRSQLGGTVSPVQPAPVQPATNASPAQPAPAIQSVAVVEPAEPVNVPSSNGGRSKALAEGMLAVVSEKTGYPAEMLELSMDMEADLGIDSIKRVEILGAMRERFTELPPFKAEELAELRTLQQIVDYMRAQLGGDTSPVQPAPVVQPAVQSEPAAPITVAPTTNGHQAKALAEGMLVVVSEKTGYPAEMLEMSMDMEADLGIDSIKRVEILGAMRERFTELPPFKAEELAELRTLQQIVDYMNGQLSASTVVSAAVPEVQPASFFKVAWGQHDIPRSTVTLKHLPRPDHLDFQPPAGAVCLLTDDGSPLTAALAQTLETCGWQVVVLSFPVALFPPSAALPAAIQRVMLPDQSETQLKAAVESITNQFGPVHTFIHLNPTHQRFSRNGDLFLEQEKQIIKHVFLLAKYLKPALTEAARTSRSSFMSVVWLGGTLGVDPKGHFGAIASGLFGLVKSLNLEWEAVYCRALDLASDFSTVDAVHHIIAELYDPNRLIVEVGYSPAGRLTLVAQPSELNPAE